MENKKYTCAEIISCLFSLQVSAHIRHLQTKSFAEHKALDDLYSALSGHIDALVEAFQGKYPIVTGYKVNEIKEYGSKDEFITMLKEKLMEVQVFGKMMTDNYLSQLIDNIAELISGTLYKLKNLN
jgi:hypothetical protein